MNVLPMEKQVRVIAALTEGCSIRSTERLTDVNRETVMTLGVRVGEGCMRLHDAMMRNLQVGVLEIDEQWQYVGCKSRHVQPGEEAERGDFYLFVGLAASSKAIVSYVVGKRNGANTHALVRDLRARVINRPQITSDGWRAYPDAIDDAFGADVDFATIVKDYVTTPGNEAAVRYSPGKIRGVEKTVRRGDPDPSCISTSYVERFNLSTRMSSKRFARLSNGFSKKLANHRAAVALHIAVYNLTRVHESIRCTPAMALGVTDHVWTIQELITAALAAQEPAPFAPPPPFVVGMSAGKAKGAKGGGGNRWLHMIKGGKAPK